MRLTVTDPDGLALVHLPKAPVALQHHGIQPGIARLFIKSEGTIQAGPAVPRRAAMPAGGHHRLEE